MNTYDGRESSDTFKELLFASNLFVHRYWMREGGGIYIASSIEYVEEEDFSHISFSFPYTPFLPIISFLGIRLDGMMIECCTYLSSLLKRLGVKSSPYFSYHPFLASVQKKGYKYDGDHRITLFHPLVFFP